MVSSLETFYWYIGIIFVLELNANIIVRLLRKDFQWLITTQDFFPTIDKKTLRKFLISGYDPELGWVRKPGTAKEEYGAQGKTKYSINDNGCRANPGHEKLPNIVSCYGDSFVFARQVNDDQTFAWYLSEMTNSNVLNFGVGNYGLDQSLLRLKREYPRNRTKVVIMGVVPSTIVRILSVWKHYNEYGNIYGFKPRFILSNGKIELVKNIIDDDHKFESYYKYLPEINRYDAFYETKFKKEMIIFPYFMSIIANPFRNIPLISMVAYYRWFRNTCGGQGYPPPVNIIMKNNLHLRKALFLTNKNAKQLLEKIVLEFCSFGEINNFIPVFLWLPQKDDIFYIRTHGCYYHDFIGRIKGKVMVIDFASELMYRSDLDDLYSDNSRYGGHFSNKGNKVVAEIIYRELKRNNIL